MTHWSLSHFAVHKLLYINERFGNLNVLIIIFFKLFIEFGRMFRMMVNEKFKNKILRIQMKKRNYLLIALSCWFIISSQGLAAQVWSPDGSLIAFFYLHEITRSKLLLMRIHCIKHAYLKDFECRNRLSFVYIHPLFTTT